MVTYGHDHLWVNTPPVDDLSKYTSPEGTYGETTIPVGTKWVKTTFPVGTSVKTFPVGTYGLIHPVGPYG